MSDTPDETLPAQQAAHSASGSAGGTSGWEKADKVASGVGSVVHGIGWIVMKIYAVVLIVVGFVVLLGLDNGARFIGLALIVYGIYLIAPGSKFVIY